FLVYGAPFVDGQAWAAALEKRKLDGLSFEAVDFTPASSSHAKKSCHGVRVKVTDAKKVRSVTAALHMIETLAALTSDFKFEDAGGMLGERDALKKGSQIEDLVARWEKSDFRERRK